MGMDIYGIDPVSKEGEYFRSNVWGWRPVHMICELMNRTHNLKVDMSKWGFNDGHGLKTQEDCDRLAEALDDFIKNDLGPGGTFQINVPEGRRMPEALIMKALGYKDKEKYSIQKEHLLEFVRFLRSCGGFEID